jgi:hypothetical protein
LAAVLLGVPRAIDTRAFGAQRSVYVDLAPLASELRDFATELERAIGETTYSLAARRSEATLVVEVLHGPGRCRDGGGHVRRPRRAARSAGGPALPAGATGRCRPLVARETARLSRLTPSITLNTPGRIPEIAEPELT